MTIGYLTNDLLASYNYRIWQGIRKVCKQKDINFLNFSGGELNSPHSIQYSRNKVYDLINKKSIDGLIINASTLFHYVHLEKISSFYQRFKGIPVVNIGVKIGDIPAVLVDNKKGLKDGLVHFIENHGYKRIAFIKGPGNNEESRLRFAAYTEILEKYGIEIDPDLIEEGDFSFYTGIECLNTLLSKNKKFDAVVAANDDMALGVLDKALRLGIAVPNELAIMGFDDIEEARYSPIPLTTVQQPLFKQAEKATGMLVALINQEKKTGEDIVLDTELVIRRSCGCFSHTILHAHPLDMNDNQPLSFYDLIKNKDLVLHQLQSIRINHIKNDQSFHDYQWFLDSFIDYLETGRPETILTKMDSLLNKAASDTTLDIDIWQNVLSECIRCTLPYLKNDIPLLIKAENIWHQVRILIQETQLYSRSHVHMMSEHESANLRYASENLISIFDLKKFITTMLEELPRLGVKSCYLSLYDDAMGGEKYSRLILAYSEKGREHVPPGGIHYKTEDLLPGNIKQSNKLDNYIIESLFFQEKQFGFILFKINPQKNIFESIRHKISAAIKGALLVQDIFDKENKLKALVKEQKKRSKELETAYRTLKENQEKMIIMEKMASLGRMTAGIAHEMNTPLAAIRASLVELESLAQEYKKSITEPEVQESDHREIVKDMKRSLSIAKKAGTRVAQFLQSVKFQTRDLTPKDHYLFNAVDIINDTILLLNHTLKKNNCTIEIIQPAENIVLYGSHGKFSQVITNLLTNAVDAYSGKGGGPVRIELSRDESGVIIRISDKGSGITETNLKKIFDPLFTTKSLGRGTGLGLAIVNNIVTGDFKGSVDVESKVEEGTTFILWFPKPPEGI